MASRKRKNVPACFELNQPRSFRRSLTSEGFPNGYSKSVFVCVRLHSESSEPIIFLQQTMPDEHPPTPPPTRWQVITLPHLAKFQLVWRRMCDVLFPSCLFEHTLTAVCVLPEDQSGRKYNIHSYIW